MRSYANYFEAMEILERKLQELDRRVREEANEDDRRRRADGDDASEAVAMTEQCEGGPECPNQVIVPPPPSSSSSSQRQFRGIRRRMSESSELDARGDDGGMPHDGGYGDNGGNGRAVPPEQCTGPPPAARDVPPSTHHRRRVGTTRHHLQRRLSTSGSGNGKMLQTERYNVVSSSECGSPDMPPSSHRQCRGNLQSQIQHLPIDGSDPSFSSHKSTSSSAHHPPSLAAGTFSNEGKDHAGFGLHKKDAVFLAADAVTDETTQGRMAASGSIGMRDGASCRSSDWERNSLVISPTNSTSNKQTTSYDENSTEVSEGGMPIIHARRSGLKKLSKLVPIQESGIHSVETETELEEDGSVVISVGNWCHMMPSIDDASSSNGGRIKRKSDAYKYHGDFDPEPTWDEDGSVVLSVGNWCTGLPSVDSPSAVRVGANKYRTDSVTESTWDKDEDGTAVASVYEGGCGFYDETPIIGCSRFTRSDAVVGMESVLSESSAVEAIEVKYVSPKRHVLPLKTAFRDRVTVFFRPKSGKVKFAVHGNESSNYNIKTPKTTLGEPTSCGRAAPSSSSTAVKRGRKSTRGRGILHKSFTKSLQRRSSKYRAAEKSSRLKHIVQDEPNPHQRARTANEERVCLDLHHFADEELAHDDPQTIGIGAKANANAAPSSSLAAVKKVLTSIAPRLSLRKSFLKRLRKCDPKSSVKEEGSRHATITEVKSAPSEGSCCTFINEVASAPSMFVDLPESASGHMFNLCVPLKLTDYDSLAVKSDGSSEKSVQEATNKHLKDTARVSVSTTPSCSTKNPDDESWFQTILTKSTRDFAEKSFAGTSYAETRSSTSYSDNAMQAGCNFILRDFIFM